MVETLVILAVTIIFFILGKIRSDIVALGSLLALLLTNVLTPAEALSGFSSSIVLIMAGVFVVGGAVFRTGLARKLSSKVLLLAGANETKLFILIMLITAGIGAFVSNTGTVALMMPIVISLTTTAHMNPSRFLMPLAFISSMGGMLTLIGTPPNMVISDTLVSINLPPLTLFSFFPVGIICVSIGAVALFFLSKFFLSPPASPDAEQEKPFPSLPELITKYNLDRNVYRMFVPRLSPMIGKTLEELGMSARYGLMVVEIRRVPKDKKMFSSHATDQINPTGKTILLENDILFITGTLEHISSLQEDFKLKYADVIPALEEKNEEESYTQRFDSIGIAELVLLSTSRFINRMVCESHLREDFGLTIIGIQRKDEYLLGDLKDRKILAGDALLVQGEWGKIATLAKFRKEWVVVGQPLEEISKMPLNSRSPIAALIMALMVLVMAFSLLPAVTAVLLAALVMVLCGCFRNVEEAYSFINWESIILIAAMLPMALAIEKTGITAAAGIFLAETLSNSDPYLLLAVIYIATSLMTLLISNTATSLLIAPIAIQVATALHYSPYPFLFAVAVAASMCFASPFSSPPNALVMSAGRYSFMDYIKVGVPLQTLFAVVMIFALPLIFPFFP